MWATLRSYTITPEERHSIMGLRPKLLPFSDLSEVDEHQLKNPIGFRKNGDPIFQIAGGSGEDDDDEDDDTSGATVPIARFLKTQNRMKAADRRANTAEARVAELEPIAAKVPELEKQVEAEAEKVKKLRIDNAFLTSDVEWVDAEAALRLVDLSDVEIKDDGTVKGLKEALEALATAKPYLVKPKEEEAKGKKGKGKGKAGSKDEDVDDEDESDEESDEEDEDDDEDEDEEGDTSGAAGKRLTSVQGGASGTSTGSGKRRRKGKGPSDQELMTRYRI